MQNRRVKFFFRVGIVLASGEIDFRLDCLVAGDLLCCLKCAVFLDERTGNRRGLIALCFGQFVKRGKDGVSDIGLYAVWVEALVGLLVRHGRSQCVG